MSFRYGIIYMYVFPPLCRKLWRKRQPYFQYALPICLNGSKVMPVKMVYLCLNKIIWYSSLTSLELMVFLQLYLATYIRKVKLFENQLFILGFYISRATFKFPINDDDVYTLEHGSGECNELAQVTGIGKEVDSLEKDCSNSIAHAQKLLQSCTNRSIWSLEITTINLYSRITL